MARVGPAVSDQAGRMIAQLVAKVVKDTRLATAPAEQEVRRRGTEAMMDAWEGEVGQFAADLIGKMAAGEDPHPTIKAMVDRGQSPVHQTDFILSLLVGLAGAFALIGTGGQIVWQNTFNDLRKENRYIPLSAPDAADGVERNRWSQEQGDSWAAQSGINPAAFQAMVDLVGEPPGLSEMLRLWRRGDLDTATLETMIAYSRVKTAWTKYVELAATEVPSGADAVEGYIKGVIGESDATQKYYEAGGRTEDFGFMADTAGEAIGVVSALNLFNHDLITEAEVAAVIAYSRINPKFEAIAQLQRHHFLAPFQIEQALKAGEATPAEATTWLLQDGFPADQVAALVSGSVTVKVATHKEATVAVVLDSYQAGMLSAAQTTAALGNLGYTGEEASLVIQSRDAAKTVSLQAKSIAVVGKSYVASKVTRTQASSDLDALGVHPQVRDHYLETWDIEIKDGFRTLTMAQIGSLAKNGIITYHYAITRWMAMGYDSVDALLLSYEYDNALPVGGTGL